MTDAPNEHEMTHLPTHVVACHERYKAFIDALARGSQRMARIEKILYAIAACLILVNVPEVQALIELLK